MKIKKEHLILFTLLFTVLFQNEVQSCSMYKITADGKTMVGCNHDAWLTTPKVWFENAGNAKEYGAAFTGARQVSNNKTTPQSGMNTAGLTFSRLTSYHPLQNNPFTNRLKVTDEADYLTDILHTCASVKEVRKYIEKYDHSFFINDVFIYIDSLGDYLIVEPYNLIEGNDPNYVLANFCPSITDNEQARKLDRYRKGEDFLKTNKTIPSLDFCRTLSDTMSICRKRNGDGTLLTSIWDTKDKMVSLYFYHAYDTVVQYSLKDELAKGDHTLNVPEIFPRNSDFERLVNYKTPSNTIELRFLLVILAGLLAFFSFGLWMSQIWSKKSESVSLKSTVIISLLNLVLIAYIVVLITNKSIFYFDVPYEHYSSSLISASSYTPFLLLLLFVPILFYTINKLKLNEMKLWTKAVLLSNNIVYFILVLGFGYWGLYNFW